MFLTAWCEAVIGHRKMASALLDAHEDRIAMKQSDNRCIVMRWGRAIACAVPDYTVISITKDIQRIAKICDIF